MTTTAPSPTRRTALATALALLALLLLAGAAAPAAAPAKAKPKPKKCPTAGSTIAKSSQARIYQVEVETGDELETRTYGCWLPTGDRLRLDERCDPDDGSPAGDDACNDDPSDVALNGKYVALATSSLYYGESGNTYAKIVRGKLGSKPAIDEPGRINNRQGTELGPFITKMFVSKRGAIAYSATDVEDGTNVIGYISPAGERPDLDMGDDVSDTSLTVVGKTVTWTRGGVLKTAPFA
jgi:hypothetical protein